MPFAGDSIDIPISSLLQALVMDGQEGILTVFHPEFGSRRLRVLNRGLRPLAIAPGEPDLLLLALQKERLLTEAECNNALSTWNATQSFPGDFLLRRRLITQEQVRGPIHKHLGEYLLELLENHADLHYDFLAEEEREDLEFFDPEQLGLALTFSLNGILMECARRDDDWGRMGKLASPYRVYKPTSVLPRKQPRELALDPGQYREARLHITGERPISSIAAETKLSRYEAHKLVAALHEAGLIEELAFEERVGLAKKLRKLGKLREATPIYRGLIEDSPGRMDLREDLVATLLKSGDKTGLLKTEREQLLQYYRQYDPVRALELCDEILADDPRNLCAMEEQFTLYNEARRRESALSAVRNLLKIYAEKPDPEAETACLERLCRAAPKEPFVLLELAQRKVAADLPDKALELMSRAAEIYRENGDSKRLAKTCRMISELNPTHAAQWERSLGGKKKSEAKKGLRAGVVIAAIVILPLLALGLYFGLNELHSRSAWADVKRSVRVHLEEENTANARQAVLRFLNVFAWSTHRDEARELLAEIDTGVGTRRATLEAREEEQLALDVDLSSTLVRARALVESANLTGALALLEKSASRQGASGSHDGELAALATEIRTRLNEARTLAVAMKTAGRSKYREAHAHGMRLLSQYADTPEVVGLKLPVLLRTSPEGCSISVAGKKLAYRTPILLNVRAREPVRLELSKKGFRARVFEFDPRQAPEFHATLQKGHAWSQATGGSIECSPIGTESGIVVSNRNGAVLCFRSDGSEAWRLELPERTDLTAGFGSDGALVYTGGHDGLVYVIDSSTGRLEHPPIRATPGAHWIREKPSAAGQRGIAAFNCGGRSLSGVDIRRGRLAWTHSVTSSRLLGAPGLLGERIVAMTERGAILELHQRTGRLRSQRKASGRPATTPAFDGGRAFYALDGSELACFDLEAGRELWRVKLGSPATAAPRVVGQRVIIPHGQELSAFDAGSGYRLWSAKIGANIDVPIVSDGRRVFLCKSSGELAALDLETRKIEWAYSHLTSEGRPSRLSAAGLPGKESFYQGTETGDLYRVDFESR